MSVAGQRSAVSVQDIRRRKGGEPIVCLTAYTAPIARILDPRVDLVLVGDTLGMVVYGMETTLGVTLDTMIAHGRTVARCCRHACVVVDMPFGSYQESPQQAYRNAARVLAETGCAAVKMEGGAEMAETVAYLVKRGIPVLGTSAFCRNRSTPTADFAIRAGTMPGRGRSWRGSGAPEPRPSPSARPTCRSGPSSGHVRTWIRPWRC